MKIDWNPPKTEADILSMIQDRVRQLGSQKRAAQKLGVSAQYLSDVLRKRREPGKSILEALGYEKRTMYHKL